MANFSADDLRRETLQRAVHSRFNMHPRTNNKLLYTDAWLVARHAVEAMLEAEAQPAVHADDTGASEAGH